MNPNSPIILPYLDKILGKYCQNHQQLNNVKFTQQLCLAILERNPFYMTDSIHSIQVNIFYQNKKVGSNQLLRPMNRMRSPYYNPYQNAWITLNCKDQDVEQPYQYPHPYGPYFHFRERYQQFLKQRNSRKQGKQYDTLLINQWGLKIVNIANTGYYAPILQIYQYTAGKPKYLRNNKISSILYQKTIQQIMENLRLKDLRLKQKQQQPKVNPNSLCYYLRSNSKNIKTLKTLTPFITADYQKKILKYNQDIQKKFICVSQIQGICCFMPPLYIGDVKKGNNQQLNYNALEFMLAQQQINNNNNRSSISYSSLSESNSSLQIDKQDKLDISQQRMQVEDSDSSQQDPLRNLYKKQIVRDR